MKYYKVKPEKDNTDKFVFVGSDKTKIKNDGFFVGNELYTPKERERIARSDSIFDIVDIPKNKIYFFFGARFSSLTGGYIHYDEKGGIIG